MKEKDALKIERLRKAFEEDFDSRFAGRKILKTALHAIGYCIMAENTNMKERAYAEAWGGKYDRWIAYCKKTGTADTWCNSVEWYVTGKVEAAK